MKGPYRLSGRTTRCQLIAPSPGRGRSMEVFWLGHADCHDITRAGAKAAHLSRLAAAYRIPPGFCISATAYAQWAERTGIEQVASSSSLLPPALYNALAAAYR